MIVRRCIESYKWRLSEEILKHRLNRQCIHRRRCIDLDIIQRACFGCCWRSFRTSWTDTTKKWKTPNGLYSRRSKTVRNYRITYRNVFPDGQPSGIGRQDSVVKKDLTFLTVGRQEFFPDGSSWRTTGGPVWLNTWWLPVRNMWFWPSGNQLWAVKKLHMRNYIHQIQFVC